MRRRIAITTMLLGVAAPVLVLAQATTQPTTQPASVLGPGTRVTLSFKETPAKEAFEQLAKQSKFKLNPAPANVFEQSAAPPVTLEAVDMPWLEAVTQMSLQTSLRAQQVGENWSLMQGSDRRLSGRRATVGPLMFILHSVNVDTELRYGETNRTTRTVQLSGAMTSEPSLPTTGVSGAMQVVAVDNRGRTVKSTTLTPLQSGQVNRRDFNISLTVPEMDATQLATLDCTFLLEQVDQTADLKIDKLLTVGSSGTLRDAVFKVTDVKGQGQGQYIVTLKLNPGSLSNEALGRVQQLQPPFQPKVTDEARSTQPVNVMSFSPTTTGGTLQLLVRPVVRPAGKEANPNDTKDKLPDVTLNWKLPVTYRRIEVAVQFKDIPIPQ